ncbi:hypothetical protein F2Q70_00038837 [Brassica cretica]|uniref:DET1- and DDB1-associated protein 1 n=1 Tax=Brassica cretica TaxID=69181 RepID=A0A3N6QDF9_BRACR|nr:hypothetical protein F2Q70_00038837 [Brassica cretica]KAF3497056.1 hypothetical protein DY000_02053109 [Brassica cretica]
MTHEEFAAKHPPPPKPFIANIGRHSEKITDRQRESTGDRRASLCYQVHLSKINVAQLNTLRNPSQPSETSTYNIIEQSEDAPEPMQVDQATMGRTLRKRKEKCSQASEERS